MITYDDLTLRYYDQNATAFTASSIKANMSAVCERFLGLLPAGAYILDLGCGTGRDSRYFVDRGYRALPVDGSAEMCRIATETAGVQAVQKRFEELDFESEFDGVWACASLLHASREQLPVIMKKVNRALKPSGVAYLSFKYGVNAEIRNGRFFTDMKEEDISFLCNSETGFDVEEFFITEDVRPDRPGERWLNIYARKI